MGISSGQTSPPDSEWTIDLSARLQQIEYNYLEQYYSHYGNIRDAAAALGLNRSTFSRRRTELMEKFQNKTSKSEGTDTFP